ncbi:MAG: DUF3016 domain-containing protein [Dokdonella sp.]
MRTVSPIHCLTAVLLSMALLACAPMAPRRIDTPALSNNNVTVHMVNPDQFSEMRQNRNYGDTRDGSWLVELQKYVVDRAGRRLASGQQLDVNITDIKRAGDFEPWRGPNFNDIRVVKEIYPPRIDVNYVLKDGNDSVIREGNDKLTDLAFLRRIVRNSTDPLRFEKRLIDDWLGKVLPL